MMRLSTIWTTVTAILLSLPYPSQCEENIITPLPPTALKKRILIGDPSFRHAGNITHLAAMPDGKHLLSSSKDGTARTWDIKTGKEIKRFPIKTDETVWNVTLVPGGKEILTTGGKSVILWDIDKGTKVRSFIHGETVFRSACSRDGSLIASTDYSNKCIIWDRKTGEKLHTLTGHSSSVYTALFSRDQKKIITGSSDQTIRFWNVDTGEQTKQVGKLSGDVFTLSHSPDRKSFLASVEKTGIELRSDIDGTIIWQALLPKTAHCAAWSPDGKSIAAACSETNLYLINAENGAIITNAPMPGDNHWGVTYSIDGKSLYCGSEHLVCRYNPTTGERVFPKPDSRFFCSGITCLETDGKSLFAGGNQKNILVFRISDGTIIKTLKTGKPITDMDISPDGKTLLAVSEQGPLYAFAVESGELIKKIANSGRIESVSFTHDGKKFLTAGNSSTVQTWTIADFQPDESLTGHSDDVEKLSENCTATFAASISDDKTIRTWDLNSGNSVNVIPFYSDNIKTCIFMEHDDGCLMAAGNNKLFAWFNKSPDSKEVPENEIEQAIKELGAKSFKTRNRASRLLESAGRKIVKRLSQVQSDDPEIQERIEEIISKINKSNKLNSMKPAVLSLNNLASNLAVHPDGKHWALACDSEGYSHILIGTASKGKLKIIRKIRDDNSPGCIQFGKDGTLYTGNRNGTFSIYRN